MTVICVGVLGEMPRDRARNEKTAGGEWILNMLGFVSAQVTASVDT